VLEVLEALVFLKRAAQMVAILFLTASHQLVVAAAHKAFHPMPPMQHLTALAAALEAAVAVLTLVEVVLVVLEHQDRVMLAAMEITALMLAVVVALVLLALMLRPMLEAMAALELPHLFLVLR
jgi:hypothetical protein